MCSSIRQRSTSSLCTDPRPNSELILYERGCGGPSDGVAYLQDLPDVERHLCLGTCCVQERRKGREATAQSLSPPPSPLFPSVLSSLQPRSSIFSSICKISIKNTLRMTQDTGSSPGLRRRATTADKSPQTPPQSRPSPEATTSSHKPIDPASVYGSSQAPGSSHTAYIPPEKSPFREPELVMDEEPIPADPTPWDPSNAWGESNVDWDAAVNWGDTDMGSIRKVPIDGRDENEELHWYDPVVHAARPGPGVLPPLMAEMLHDPDHALYSVITQPHTPSTTSHVPSADELRAAIPHPNAYYCKEHNGWVFLQWKSSTVLPPLVKEFSTPLPDQARRKRTVSCVGDGEQPFGPTNLTHHWHRYEKAVDATKLNPPYTRGELLLDLYLCCQCSLYCLVSDVIPGVIPTNLVDDFTRDKLSHPAIDKTPRATVVAGWETILT